MSKFKARCINAGPHHQYEVGRVYEYSVLCGVCDIKGAMSVSKTFFNNFFEEIKDDGNG